MLDLAECCCCCCYYKATRALVGRLIEAETRLLVFEIVKVNKELRASAISNAQHGKVSDVGSWLSASEQDGMELCKDSCRPATLYNVDSSNCL